MDVNKLKDFKESQLTKEFFEVLRKHREVLKEQTVSLYEVGMGKAMETITKDIIYLNGYTQCLEDIVNLNQEVINDIIELYREKIRPILNSDPGIDFNRPNDLNKIN